MAAPTAFHRAFANRQLFRGSGLRAFLWSLLSAVATIGLFGVVGLLLGLGVHRGRMNTVLTRSEAFRLEAISGQPLIPPEFRAEPEKGNDPGAPGGASEQGILIKRDELGILPSVWHSRDRWWGGVIGLVYRHVPLLQSNISALATLLLTGGLLALIRLGCLSQIRRNSRAASIDAGLTIRRSLHRQALRLGAEDLSGHTTDSTVDLFVTKTSEVGIAIFEYVYRLARFPLELAALAIAMLSVSPLLTAEWLPPLALCWYLLSLGRQRAEAAHQLAEDRTRVDLDVLANGLRRARLIRGYGLETRENEQFQAQLTRYADNLRTKAKAQDDVMWMRLVLNLAIVAIIMFLVFITFGKMLAQNDLTIPDVLMFLAASILTVPGIRKLMGLKAVQQAGTEAAGGIFRYIDQLPQVSQAVGARFLQPLSKVVHFERLTYTPPGESTPLLRDLDLRLKANRSYALVSLDPEEAKAVVLSLPRFIEPQSGRILVDGEDVAWSTLESIRAEILFVTADDAVLSGTVLDNIRAGGEYTLQQCTDAAKESHAHQFIVNLFNGYETILDPRDPQLDRGQIFRLALARALVRKPAVLIIEEPAISLDEDTKTLLEDAYDRLLHNRTVFFLPRRLSTLRRVDEIVVISRGQVQAIGPHAVLVKQMPLYRHWEYLRFNEFRHLDDHAASLAAKKK